MKIAIAFVSIIAIITICIVVAQIGLLFGWSGRQGQQSQWPNTQRSPLALLHCTQRQNHEIKLMKKISTIRSSSSQYQIALIKRQIKSEHCQSANGKGGVYCLFLARKLNPASLTTDNNPQGVFFTT